jgi:DNA-binding NarL/FixJ family response regulator
LPEVERRADHGYRLAFVYGHPTEYASPLAGANVRVLLADDDEGFLESLRTLIDGQPNLSVAGTAADGLAAIELADSLDPDAVVIDLHMPLLDGVSAVARLRRDHPSLCLIALTGDDAQRIHDAVREAGADAVIVKEDFLGALMDRLRAVRTNS